MDIDDVRRPCSRQLAARAKRLAWTSAKIASTSSSDSAEEPLSSCRTRVLARTAAVSNALLPPWAVLGCTFVHAMLFEIHKGG